MRKRLLAAIFLFSVLELHAFSAGGQVLGRARVGIALSRLTASHGYPASTAGGQLASVRLKRMNASRLPLIVVTGSPEKTALAILKNGGTVGAITKNTVTAELPLASLGAVLEEPSVRYVDLPAEKHLRLDQSNKDVGAFTVNAGTELPAPYDGSKVVLGLADTGIDVRHPDFKNADGSSRIEFLWDQGISPASNPPPEYGFGMECAGEVLNNGTCGSKDEVGHGTHCSGIMGGGGKTYRGMAPGGSYIAVAGIDRLVEGASYVFKRADGLGMPAVLNLSLGWHAGAHDGTSPEELAMADMTETPGHVIVAAAGNEGSDYIHLGYQATETVNKTYLEVRVDPGLTGVVYLDAWSVPGTAIEYAVGIGYAGGAEIAETAFYNGETGSGPVQHVLSKAGTQYGTVEFDSQLYGGNGKYNVFVAIAPKTSDPDTTFENESGYVYYLKVRGRGWFDAWIASENLESQNTSFSTTAGAGIVPGDNDRSVGMPAVSPRVISVAAYTTKTQWQDIESNWWETKGIIGNIAFFSSRGPSADEQRTGYKPEISAPGQVIASALSGSAVGMPKAYELSTSYVMMQGTSMSSPHVAGIVALMLQADPSLTVDKTRRILMKTAQLGGFAGGVKSYTWGAGKLRALPAVKMALGTGACDSQDDCKDGRICTGGNCLQTEGGDCYSETDCAKGLVCDEGHTCAGTGGCSCASVGI